MDWDWTKEDNDIVAVIARRDDDSESEDTLLKMIDDEYFVKYRSEKDWEACEEDLESHKDAFGDRCHIRTEKGNAEFIAAAHGLSFFSIEIKFDALSNSTESCITETVNPLGQVVASENTDPKNRWCVFEEEERLLCECLEFNANALQEALIKRSDGSFHVIVICGSEKLDETLKQCRALAQNLIREGLKEYADKIEKAAKKAARQMAELQLIERNLASAIV